MIIKKIRLNNIRSYESQEVIFQEGSTVLAGDIGSGKTSVLLAIEFALFGLQPGQKGSSLLRHDKDDGSVILEFELEGKNIIIERGLKRGKSVTQSYAQIEIDREKKEISVTELKNKILSMLQYPKEFAKKTNLLYKFTVYTPQEEMKQIILETPETRLNMLRHIFGIDKYKRVRENAEILTLKLREQARDYEGQIKNLEEINKKLMEKQESMDKIKSSLISLKEELEKRKHERKSGEEQIKGIEEKIKEKERYEKEIEKTGIMLAGKKELISRMEREKKNMLEQIQEARKISFSSEELNNAKEAKSSAESKLDAKNKYYMELVGEINSIKSRIAESEKLKEKISSMKHCPTCLQCVNDDYKINITRKFDEDMQKSSREAAALNGEKIKITEETDALKQEISSLNNKINDLNLLRIKLEGVQEKEARVQDLEKQEFTAGKDNVLLEKQIFTLKESAALLKKYETTYELKRKELEDLFRKEKEKEIEFASTEKEKELTLRSIEEITKEIKEKEKIKLRLLEIAELEDWLSSSFLSVISFTERNIMLKLREEFSKLFNEWFNILVPENFTVKLDEDFTPIIEQQDYQLEYSFLSGGERTAIALAYRLALNQIINSLLSKIKTHDIVILDEPTDGFSEQQLDKMRDVLYELNAKQLIIVSHEAKIESFVENIIKFRKEEGITKVEM